MPAPYVLVPAGTLSGRGSGDRVDLPDEVRHHLARVLRLRPGAGVVVADGAGVTASGRLGNGDVRLQSDPTTEPAPAPRVHVWQAIGKGRKHDEVCLLYTSDAADE